MTLEYKKTEIDRLLVEEHPKPILVEVEGIPRGSIETYPGFAALLESSTGNLLPINGSIRSNILGVSVRHNYKAVVLMRAASETGYEMTIRGVYQTKEIKGVPAELTVHRLEFRDIFYEANIFKNTSELVE